MSIFVVPLMICITMAASPVASLASSVVETSNDEFLLRNMESLIEEVAYVYMKGFNCIAWVHGRGSPIITPSPHLYQLVVALDDMTESNLLLQIFAFKCQGWILQLDDPVRFLKRWNDARNESLVRFSPKFLFLPWNDTNYASALFQSSTLDYISDATAVVLSPRSSKTSDKSKLEIFSINFSTTDDLRTKTSEVSLGTWPSQSSFSIFPDKMANLNEKELRVATLQYLPYSQLYPDLDGVEIRVLRTFCKTSNCTLVAVADEDMWGDIFDNGTSNGILGNVVTDKADVGVGAVYLWHYKWIDFSYPYLPSRVSVLLPKPSRLPEWRVPLAPFDVTLWITLLASIMLSSLVLFASNKWLLKYSKDHVTPSGFENFTGVFLLSLGMAVLQSPGTAFRSSASLRIIFTTFELLFLLYTTIYGSALSSVLTVPSYYPPIDNMRELYLSGLPWTADHEAWVKNLRNADVPYIQGLLKNFEVHDQATLAELSKKGGYGFTIELTNGGHVSEASFLSAEMINNLHLMKEQLYHSYSTAIVRKGSPYVQKLNELIHRCLDTGLLKMWESDLMSKFGSSIIQTAFRLSRSAHQNNDNSLVNLGLVHTQGAFFILIAGITAGSVIFLMEVYTKNKIKLLG